MILTPTMIPASILPSTQINRPFPQDFVNDTTTSETYHKGGCFDPSTFKPDIQLHLRAQ